MKKLHWLILVCGLFVSTSFGCNKNSNDNSLSKLDNQNVPGLILYYGDPAVDGCGWMIEINKVIYSPITLDDAFKKDSLKVILDYQTLSTTWNCGWRNPGYPQIKISNIKQL